MTSSQILRTKPYTYKERLELFRKDVIEHYLIDFNRATMDDDIVKTMSISWEEHLFDSGANPSEYYKIYKLAVQIYSKTDAGKGPFNVTHLIQAANKLQEIKHRNNTLPYFEIKRDRKLLKAAPICQKCFGTLLLMKEDKNRDKKILYKDGKALRCPDCMELDKVT